MPDTAVAEQVIQIPSRMVGTQWPGVGLGVYVLRDGKVLFGRRGSKSTHVVDAWCPPGGKLDFGESIADCARREVTEEAGIEIANIRLGPVTNDIFSEEGRHFITLTVLADYVSGEPQVLEDGKMEAWEWIAWKELPSRTLFLPTQNLLAQGFDPFARTLQVGVKALIKNDAGKYLLFQRREPRPGEQHKIWEIPGGRIELGEEIEAALAREIAEETGLKLERLGRCVGVQSILRNPKLHVVRNTFEVEVSGTLRPFATDDEHDKAEWFLPDEIESLHIDPYLKEVMTALV